MKNKGINMKGNVLFNSLLTHTGSYIFMIYLCKMINLIVLIFEQKHTFVNFQKSTQQKRSLIH